MNTNLLERPGTVGREVPTPPSPQIRRIITTTDFSDEARAGTDYALRLAGKLGASVLVLNVIEPFPNMEGIKGFPLFIPRPEITRQARMRLNEIAHAPAANRVRVSTSVRVGKPFHAIIAAASEQSADLIVMATHGYTGIDHALLGSTAERVVRHAPCSVLTVPIRALPSSVGRKTFGIGKILVPLDFSDTAKPALPLAAYLATALRAEIVLFNVTEIFPVDHLMGRELMNHSITPLVDDARAALERIAQNLGAATQSKISTNVTQGVPYKEICHGAEKSGADLIVVTAHGCTGLKRFWLGSTTERVVRHAGCPVLIARAPRRLHSR